MEGHAWLCNHACHLEWPWQQPCMLALQSRVIALVAEAIPKCAAHLIQQQHYTCYSCFDGCCLAGDASFQDLLPACEHSHGRRESPSNTTQDVSGQQQDHPGPHTGPCPAMSQRGLPASVQAHCFQAEAVSHHEHGRPRLLLGLQVWSHQQA